jgi:hypothetical protein
MEVYRLGVKLFCEEGSAVELPEFIPIFHRWIQEKAIGGLLIDVADYSHVPQGPGVLLIAHEGVFAVDETGGRRGLVHYRRQPLDGSLEERLAAVTRSTLTACRRLASEPEFRGRLRFRGDEIVIFGNDRLLAPNTQATLERFQPALATLAATLYPGVDCSMRPEADPKERFSVAISAPKPVSVDALLERLGG